jgi:hypothetical protein
MGDDINIFVYLLDGDVNINKPADLKKRSNPSNRFSSAEFPADPDDLTDDADAGHILFF